jgi:hypothetical protein
MVWGKVLSNQLSICGKVIAEPTARCSYERKNQDIVDSGCASHMLVSSSLCGITLFPTRQFTCHQRSFNEDFSCVLVA